MRKKLPKNCIRCLHIEYNGKRKVEYCDGMDFWTITEDDAWCTFNPKHLRIKDASYHGCGNFKRWGVTNKQLIAMGEM